jgi:hypothetical protein
MLETTPILFLFPNHLLIELSWLIISGCEAPRCLLWVVYSLTRRFKEAIINVHCTVSLQVPG